MVDMEQWIIPEGNKALVHIIIGIRAGWRHEEAGKKGITHFLEHAVLLGNREHPSPDVEAADYGVRFGGMTEPEQTLFWFTSTKEDFSNLFRLFLSLIFHPEFNKDKIEKERKEKIVPAVVHVSDFTPWELANEWAKNLTFNWDFMLSLGKDKDVRSLTRQDLKVWHGKYYTSLNSFIVIHGDIRKNEVLKLIKQANIPSGAEMPSRSETKWNKKEIFVEKDGIENMEVVYGFRLPKYDVGYEVLNTILGKWPLGKLCGNMFSKYAYATSSRTQWTSTGGGLFLNFGTNSSKSTREIDDDLWALLRDFDVDEKELQTAKKMRTLEISSIKEEGEHGLLNFVLRTPLQEHKDFDEMLSEAKRVGKDQVLTLASFLNRDNAVRVIVGSKE